MNSVAPHIALTIAGSDPSGGAGIQADLKTFSAFGIYGSSVITALTAQNTTGVTGIFKVPPEFIRAQFDAVTGDLNIAAVKTGMLADAATVTQVASLLSSAKPQALVVDPVMVATSGDRLLDQEAISLVRTKLVPLADIITPNIPEAAALLDVPNATTEPEMEDQARALLEFGCGAVLLKGGHRGNSDAADVLLIQQNNESRAHWFRLPHIATRNTHGTGCTLAAAITAGLAQGDDLVTAVQHAKRFVWAALKSGASQQVGTGNGPIDHLVFQKKLYLDT